MNPSFAAGIIVENNHLNLPNGLMDAGRATSTLSKFMTEHGATPEEVTQAQSDWQKVWEQEHHSRLPSL